MQFSLLLQTEERLAVFDILVTVDVYVGARLAPRTAWHMIWDDEMWNKDGEWAKVVVVWCDNRRCWRSDVGPIFLEVVGAAQPDLLLHALSPGNLGQRGSAAAAFRRVGHREQSKV